MTNDKKYYDLLLLFREVIMRQNLAFPENEQDEKWFDEGMKGNNATLITRVFDALSLGDINKMPF